MAGFKIRVQPGPSARRLLARMAGQGARVHAARVLAVRRAALLAEAEIKKGLRSGKPGGQQLKPLALSTILLRLKRSSRPLLDTGALLGSITSKVDVTTATAFVGVNRSATAPGGKSMVNVALIHEFGTKPYVIPVTDAMRRLFWKLHLLSGGRIRPLSPSKTEILHPGVPARPFIRPTFDAIRPRLQKIVDDTLKKALR